LFFFVGVIQESNRKEHVVKFLKRSRPGQNCFLFPRQLDQQTVSVQDVRILADPPYLDNNKRYVFKNIDDIDGLK
jgi:hypothetical protein